MNREEDLDIDLLSSRKHLPLFLLYRRGNKVKRTEQMKFLNGTANYISPGLTNEGSVESIES